MHTPILIQSSCHGVQLQYHCSFEGDDLCVILTGGDRHIGACALASPYLSNSRVVASISTIEREGHRDGELASALAKKISRAVNRVTLFVCGIHIDNLSALELEELIDLCFQLSDQLIREIQKCG